MLALVQEAAADSRTAETVAFWVFATVGLGAAIAMVTMRNVVHGALMLVVNFFAMAGMYLVLQAPFMAIVQVIVYAGAIMVLFLFVIMLLGIGRDDLLVEVPRWHKASAWALGALVAAATIWAFTGAYTSAASTCGADAPSVATAARVPCAGLGDAVAATPAGGAIGFLADRLFTRFTFAFEVVSLLLIVAITAAMVLARRQDHPDASGATDGYDTDVVAGRS